MAERLFHIGIKGLVTNEEGKILLVKTPAWEGRPSYWDIPGGRMDEDETFYQTLGRELKEEIDCEYVGEPELLKIVVSNITLPVDDMEVGLVLMVYKVSLADNSVITLNDHETDFAWFEPVEASKRLAIKYPIELTQLIAEM